MTRKRFPPFDLLMPLAARLAPWSAALRLGAGLLTLWCLVPAALAQGTLRGAVTDSLGGSTLPGANVFVTGTALGAATDINGAYRIARVPPGDYAVRVSYVGYETKTVPVTVADGETVTLDVALAPSTVLGEVVVSGQLEGQAAAINQQLSSNTIVNVVSEEKIQELPDANAAESIGRLPGVSVTRSGGEANRIVLRGLSGTFTNITVDGIKVAATDAEARSVDLSAISQGSLAGIELFKALTPDKDADAIAGSVNLVTRQAPAVRQFRVDALGSYNELANDAGQYDLDFRYGERFLGGVLGLQLTGNVERRNRSNEEYDLDYDTSINDYTSYFIEELALTATDETRRRAGLGMILDVDTPEGGVVKLSTLYNRTSRNYIEYDRNYPSAGDLVFYGARDREQEIALFNGALTGRNYVLGLDATWGASFATASSDSPFDYELQFTEPSETDSQGNATAGMGAIPPEVRRGDPAALIPYALNNYDKAYLYSAFFRGEESEDQDLSAYLNLQRDVTIGSAIRAQFKVGGKYRDKSRSRSRSELFSPYYLGPSADYVVLDDGTVARKDFSGTMFADLQRNGARVLASNFVNREAVGDDLYGQFTLNPVFDRDAIRAWWEYNQRGSYSASGFGPNGADAEYRDNIEADGYFYDIAERVSAGYVMSTLDIGRRVTWIAGLRVEHEDDDYASRYTPAQLSGFPVPTGSVRDTSAAHVETVWLPNTHLAIRPTDFLTVRLAAYRALARPDFNQRLANAVARQSGTFFPGNSVTLGNPNLQAAKAWNYEVATSFFGPRVGLFTVSAFYKDIEDMYHTLREVEFNNSDAIERFGIDYDNPFGTSRFALTLPYNSALPTEVYGLEVEHQTNLQFLPAPLSGVVLGYNLSFIRSSTFVPGARRDTSYISRPPFPPVPQVTFVFEETEQKLQEQPDFLANVSLGYDFRAFSARLSMFHQGAYYTRFSSDGRGDALRGAFTRWDLAFKQAVGGRLFLLLNVNNLTGVEETAINYNRLLDRELVSDSQIYGTTVDLGLRLDL